MYAIAFDLDTALLSQHYPGNTPSNAYHEIRAFLKGHGFKHQQGSVYFGDEDVSAVHCMLTVQALATAKSWFAVSVKDIRMLRIQDNDDLTAVVNLGASTAGHPTMGSTTALDDEAIAA